MDRLHSLQQDKHQPKLAHPLGKVVFCIHCYRTLGTESTTSSRELLVAGHKCEEEVLAKQPAAPPPFN
jgi:hypothetical protein